MKKKVILFNLEHPLIKQQLKTLLKDKTTKKNIIFASTSYNSLGCNIQDEISLTNLEFINLQPRVVKSIEHQKARTKKNAEVFTPSWVCCQMNNYCDDEWFGRTDVFNIMDGQKWRGKSGKIKFTYDKNWKEYVNLRKLEITCGECPFVVSRYDASTGEVIPISKRIGFLDRKLRVVSENATTKEDWLKWTEKAFKSSYGYEFQGDNLLIGRINLLMTFIEYYKAKWNIDPSDKELKTITNIIIWNFIQMDGLNYTVPFSSTNVPQNTQESLFKENKPEPIKSIIYDWRQNKKIKFEELREGK